MARGAAMDRYQIVESALAALEAYTSGEPAKLEPETSRPHA